ALAISAPQFQVGKVGDLGISSSDPASLFNACRVAGQLADRGVGAWGASNWAQGRHHRRSSVLLMHSLEDSLPQLREILEELKPNLVLIGAMSVCFPGAIAVARYVKALLGERVCVVLGGRHATETFYRLIGHPQVAHHRASPLALVEDGRLEDVFDVVVSGDGEFVIAEIGECVAKLLASNLPAADIRRTLDSLATAPGRWVAGACIDGHVRTVQSRGPDIDYDALPAPCEIFGVATEFDVFKVPTAHVFSDTGRGCIYDCEFCSERRSVTGLPRQAGTSAERLYRQLDAAVRVISEDHPGSSASAFCEDSTILGFSTAQIRRLEELWRERPLPIRWGGQLTIDQILSRPNLLSVLRSVGCEYLFLGLETLEPGGIGGMSKDVGVRRGSWVERAEKVYGLLRANSMTCGVAVLFGLGEAHSSRLELLRLLSEWRKRYGFPDPVSLNWAVQHPLQRDESLPYEYMDWAIPRGPLLGMFRNFGEASIRYPLAGANVPLPSEVDDVLETARSLQAPAVAPS
ncbi:B12-binding domain/radical SAM domain-containing protein, partial [Myxococcota bacterium]